MSESIESLIAKTSFGKEAAVEQEVDEYGKAMDQALVELVVEKAKNGTEEELRETLKDANELRNFIHSITLDHEGNIPIDAVQPRVDELVEKYDLGAENFNMQKLKALLDAAVKV